MKLRLLSTVALAVAVGAAALAQQPPSSSQATQSPDQDGQNGAQPAGPRGGGGWRGGGMMGRSVMGTVTEVSSDHYTVKNDAGETWTVHYSANTRVMKQSPRPAGAEVRQGAGSGEGRGQGEGRGMGMGTNPPTPIKAADIKVGDAITAMGEVDQAGKSIGAMVVMQLNPETAKRFEEMRANFGKTWLMGRVTGVNDTTVTLQSEVDNAAHSFVADENTSFRRRRDPITLADIQPGDNVRVEGALKSGQFVATSVSVMMPPAQGGPARRPGPPPQ
ncbi:MAG TPA: DUF5666 domain-containing protein [Terracidiphilus sp.]|nr:DUF5666 domain-containing protein [Terracidiphilus sp.]